ncbi:hypothetical protein KGQ19_48045 [Catenulispora sp. NL8]|uniref:Guanylate cyclase domain-containing protein n=1 Tax=Catenulispora pinistramenti TaxID=2705254 RepID=A0ABS5L8E2_9ACTN|nr:hypothetical protein [Catenulispora pinistramenti]MBS2554633.1 hypothetical protein [Catenulispora pinistramenti]
MDVVSFTRPDRDNVDQLAIRAALYDTLRDAFEDSGIPWRQTVREDRGDGVLIFVSAEVSKVLLLGRMPARLAELLEHGNDGRTPRQRFRLRVVVHAGEVHHDAHGYAGYDVNLAFRLVDAGPLREAMEHSTAAVGLIVSEGVHDGVLRHGYGGLDAAAFEQVRVQVKSADVPGWIQLFTRGAVLPVPRRVARSESGVPQGPELPDAPVAGAPAAGLVEDLDLVPGPPVGAGAGDGAAGPVAVVLADEASLLDELAGLGVRTVVLVGGAADLAAGLVPIARRPIYIDHEFIE